MWFVILCCCRESSEGKNNSICPHTGPFWEVSLFQGLGFAHCRNATRYFCNTVILYIYFNIMCMPLSNSVEFVVSIFTFAVTLHFHSNKLFWFWFSLNVNKYYIAQSSVSECQLTRDERLTIRLFCRHDCICIGSPTFEK